MLLLLLGTKDEKLLLFMAEVDNAKDEQGEGCRCQSGQSGQEWVVMVYGVFRSEMKLKGRWGL